MRVNLGREVKESTGSWGSNSGSTELDCGGGGSVEGVGMAGPPLSLSLPPPPPVESSLPTSTYSTEYTGSSSRHPPLLPSSRPACLELALCKAGS